MRKLSWEEFDDCVDHITNKCLTRGFDGVYGIPRGGLCLAVALSHSLSIPIWDYPYPGCLVVDDVYETGATLKNIKNIPSVTVFVWFSKVIPDWWQAVEVSRSNDWLVFPWESENFAGSDEKMYRNLRGRG